MKGGMALGFGPKEAVPRWLELGIREAIEENGREWWHPSTERRGEIRSKSTGEPNYLWKASATLCERLARQAIVAGAARSKIDACRSQLRSESEQLHRNQDRLYIELRGVLRHDWSRLQPPPAPPPLIKTNNKIWEEAKHEYHQKSGKSLSVQEILDHTKYTQRNVFDRWKSKKQKKKPNKVFRKLLTEDKPYLK